MEENDIQDHVREFMTVMQPDMVPCGVTIPHTGVLELRLKLVMEEAIELMEACGCGGDELDNARNHVMGIIQTYTERKNVDLPKLVDALADLDYVIEGFRITLGVDGRPIARAVHAANMAKTTGPVRADGKRLKPEGWKEPDIVGELRRQGWVG